MSADKLTRGVILVLAGGAALLQCSCLTPLRAAYYVNMQPSIDPVAGYRIDPVDDASVFSKEGLQVMVRYLSDQDLREEIDGKDNPYVYHEIDLDLGYRPTAFTVFQVTVVNPSFAKVRLEPKSAALITEHGRVLASFAINRTDAEGGVRNFEAHFLSRGVQTGNTQKLYQERMGRVRETIYHRNSPVFKGKTYSGKIAFEPLPPETRRVELVLYDFATGFGIANEPTDTIILRFPFTVSQGIREPQT